MRRRVPTLLGVVLALTFAGTSAAQARGLPLGPLGLHESRRATTLASGVTYTDIIRGKAAPEEFYAVDVRFTLDRAQAVQTAVQLRVHGYRGRVIAVDDHAPGAPFRGPTGYLARVGRYGTSADAQAAAAQIKSLGFTDVNPDWTGDDGTPTGGPWHVHVLDIDPLRFRGTVANVLATGIVPGRETVSSIASRLGALGAINGGYFVIGESDGTPGDLAGISIVGGNLLSEAVNGRTDLLLPHPGGRGARVEALSTTLTATASDGALREVNGRNRKAGLIRSCGGVGADQPTQRPLHDITCTNPSELIQFTPAFATRTDRSSETEAVLDRHGRVSELRAPGGPIPPGGSVLAGTGDGAIWLRTHAVPGTHVRVRVSVTRTAGGRPLPLTPDLGVVNGGPHLLKAGVEAIDAPAEGFTHPGDPEWYYRFGVRRNPRTMAGVTGAGHLLLVAVDGRAPGYSDGLSFHEEATVMRALGALDALNLDGGGSTTMAIGAAPVTRPSDATGERPVGDAIVIRPDSSRRRRPSCSRRRLPMVCVKSPEQVG